MRIQPLNRLDARVRRLAVLDLQDRRRGDAGSRTNGFDVGLSSAVEPRLDGSKKVHGNAKRIEIGNLAQPLSVTASGYFGGMSAAPVRDILRASVDALMRHWYGKVNKNRFAADTKINIGGAQRAVKGEIGFDVLERIAERAGVAPWQLLVPGFDPAKPPLLRGQDVGADGPEKSLLAAFRDLPEQEQAALVQDVEQRAAAWKNYALRLLEKHGATQAVPDAVVERAYYKHQTAAKAK